MVKNLKKKTIGCVFGTRPEIIKMAPIIFLLQQSNWADVKLINTGQHQKLLDTMLEVFSFEVDYHFHIMKKNQSLGQLTGKLCNELDKCLSKHTFDALFAAGDTTTVLTTALTAFYHQLPFGHVEAGLRTHQKYTPFPEEINRVLAAPLSCWHFAPTEVEKTNLLKEGINASNIYVTGNTVIDSLHWVLTHTQPPDMLNELDHIILITVHRRENFGDKLHEISLAILELARQFPERNFLFPVHLNPHVQSEVRKLLSGKPNIHLIDPIPYDKFVHLMNQSELILSDSGGLQEEAPALNKPIIILRDSTERTALIKQNLGILAGTNKESIVAAVHKLLNDPRLYASMTQGFSPYGDGFAANRITNIIQTHFCKGESLT